MIILLRLAFRLLCAAWLVFALGAALTGNLNAASATTNENPSP